MIAKRTLQHIIFCILLIGPYSALSSGVIEISAKGSTPEGTVNDVLTLDSGGKLWLESHSPHGIEVANRIGFFEAKVSPDKYSKIKTFLLSNRSKMPKLPKRIPVDAILEGVRFGTQEGEIAIWPSGETSAFIDFVMSNFSELKLLALAAPIKALELKCGTVSNKLSCSMTNVGTQALSTVNPMDVRGSLECHDKTGDLVVLNPGGPDNPNEILAGTIELTPKKAFTFTFSKPCNAVLAINTSELGINPKYKNQILGELVSK